MLSSASRGPAPDEHGQDMNAFDVSADAELLGKIMPSSFADC